MRRTGREILSAVAAVWKRPVAALVGGSKRKINNEPRLVAAYLLIEYGGYSTVDAADLMRRDRTTITRNVGEIAKRLELGDEALMKKIDQVLEELSKPFSERTRPPLGEVDGSRPCPKPIVMVTVDDWTEEVKKLRRMGWSLNAICRRTNLPQRDVARVIGVQLLEAAE